ncbi:MAG: 5-formyltetrahydrofolate cyclo-ligase [Proteobacteria bacterium]|nr:5-formyltetrahydrofolate cyclo-ligase [Pseudomonadota bacterium]
MKESIGRQKAVIRQVILQLRDALDTQERASNSRLIKESLFKLPQFIAARSVMFYVSFRSEVETHAMIREALASGKTIFVPVTDMKNKRLALSRLEDFDRDLAPGIWGIPEPPQEKIRPVAYHDIDLVIAPGAAFFANGNRIGYGGGFFDRLLRESKKSAVALAFEMQILNNIPHDPERDVPVDYIITERRVITCAAMR